MVLQQPGQYNKKKNSESEEMAIETIQGETQRKLWWGKIEKSLSDL